MAEASTYSFDLKEVVTALIKHQGIHDGVWILAIEFNFGAALVGPTKEGARPSAFVQVNKLQLARQTEISEEQSPGVNAAEVNPTTPAAPPTTISRPGRKGRKMTFEGSD
jgi:hypothetical protein